MIALDKEKGFHGSLATWVTILLIGAIGLILLAWHMWAFPISPSQNTVAISHAPNNPTVALVDNADAIIEVNSKFYAFHPNSIGMFPRISVPSLSVVKIKLKVRPGQAIQEEALDGGGLDNKTNFQEQMADSNGQLGFQFQVKRPAGSYRLAIAEDGRRSIFDFWVDPNLQHQNDKEIK